MWFFRYRTCILVLVRRSIFSVSVLTLPIGDFVNAAASDVVAFCARLTYEDFLSKTTLLNDLSSFEQLCKRATGIGYAINKVVFRGFHASDALQAMHDNSIQVGRIRLALRDLRIKFCTFVVRSARG